MGLFIVCGYNFLSLIVFNLGEVGYNIWVVLYD